LCDLGSSGLTIIVMAQNALFPKQFLRCSLSGAFIFIHLAVLAQLDSIHWIPPLATRNISSGLGTFQHSIYLSTPETSAFDVTVTTGTGTLVGTYSISNSAPFRLDLADGYNYLCMDVDSVGTVQRDDGLIFSADHGFYANYRSRSNAQGGSLTAKGRLARGKQFYWGGVPLIGSSNDLNATMGIMAMEDNTTVTIDGYDSNCAFRQGSNATGITSNSITVTLNAGETFVLEAVGQLVAEHLDGWLGASITSNNDIVMNVGNLMGGVISGSEARDICFDQTLPTERLGQNHITLRGNGTDATELVIVVATTDGTSIRVNGAAPAATINEGEYHILDGTNYSAQNNMYIETSSPAYIYQVLAGSSVTRTIGLNFIPPLNCLLPLALDNISSIDQIQSTTYNGGATILTRTGATVTINGVAPGSAPQAVSGNPDWVTYRETGLTGDVSIVSNEPMAAGMFGESGDAGFAGYFSGFSERPTPVISSNEICVPATLTLANTADNIQWHFDGLQMPGETLQTVDADNEGDYFTTAGTGTCLDTSNTINFTCNSLPVELAEFEFICDENNASLHWRTLSEYNNHFFTIEGSNNGETFFWIHQKGGQGTTDNPANYTLELSKNDAFKFYRLSQTDFDGRTEVFESVSRKDCTDSEKTLWYVDQQLLRFTGDFASELTIYNALGKAIFKKHEKTTVAPKPGSGIFILQFKDASGNWKSSRLIVP